VQQLFEPEKEDTILVKQSNTPKAKYVCKLLQNIIYDINSVTIFFQKLANAMQIFTPTIYHIRLT